MSREYLVKAHLALDAILREMIAAGLSETDDADQIRDAMDVLWYALNREEIDRIRAELAKR